MSTTDLVFEIGTEELPAADLDSAKEALSLKDGSSMAVLFQSHNIKFNNAYSYSTPRRLILHVKDIPLTQDILVQGPPRRIAYDSQQRPTKALEAFLSRNNAGLEDISISNDQNDPRVLLNKTNIPNAGILSDVLPKAVSLIDFPKKMRWDKTGVLFSRPIRWFLALFGDRVVAFDYAGILSSNITHGHRFLGRKNIKVKNAVSYFGLLKKNHVVWDNMLRKEKIVAFLEKKRWYPNRELLDEVNNLVESPFFIEGVFSKEYLQIPREVLLASMSKHQRIFCLQDKKGNLLNRFVGVINGNYKDKNHIRKNFENVLDARLKDALFFYRSDTKKPLSHWARLLSGVVFHKELGTMAEKVERIKRAAQFICNKSHIDIDKGDLSHAASLCKADLLTDMVKEFPGLQGVMGMYYALESGENQTVARAIAEHYLPRFADDETPSSAAGMACSLADKLDNIVCYFKIGKAPKGSWDPYALRRQAIGIISILLKNKTHLSISDAVDFLYPLCPGKMDKAGVKTSILDFFKDRFVALAKTRENYPYDLMDAVTGSGIDDIYKSYLKLEALNSIIDEICFENARVIVERTHNIVKASKDVPGEVDESLLSEPKEKEVYKRLKSIEARFLDYCRDKAYDKATGLFSDTLSECLHEFFEKIMVNVDHKKTRVNRLSLLLRINKLYTDNIADLSRMISKALGQTPSEHDLGPVPKQKGGTVNGSCGCSEKKEKGSRFG
jgi:glycyl-tRNA synthetase beta chain